MEKVLKATYRTKNIFADGYVIITDEQCEGIFADDRILIFFRNNKTNLFLTGFNYSTEKFLLHRFIIPNEIFLDSLQEYDFMDGDEILHLCLMNEIHDRSKISYVKEMILQSNT